MAGKGDSNMKMLAILTAGLVAVGVPQTILAQGTSAKNASAAVQIVEARKANAALMRQYTWNSRTELTEKGEIKDTRIEFVSYGPDGQVQRSPWDNQSAPLPGGFLRRAIAERDRQKMEDYLTGLRSLLDQYTLPTAGKVLDFMDQAAATGPDAVGSLMMTGSGVVVPGDTLSIWTNAATRQTRKIEITTFYQGDVVMVTATFKTIPSGLTYMAYAEAIIANKELTLQVQNYDYTHTTPAPPPQVTVQKPQPPAPAAPPPKASPGGTSLQTVEQKLRDLKALFDQGLITQSDYDAKKAQILESM
jgi:hypothetical protein